MIYRKKPIAVNAWLTSALMDAAPQDLPADVMAASRSGVLTFAADFISIQTLEGTMRAAPSDYLIQGIQGEFYPCKPDIFESTYEPVE